MKDLTGNKFGRWVVVSFSHKVNSSKGANYYWNCRCECGTERVVSASSLRLGTSTSCGCYNREIISAPKKHGMSKTRLFGIWHAIHQRCENKNNSEYKNYGAKGICVCSEWKDSKAFFDWALANGYREGLTIDRIDFNGNYEPSNCRWVDWKIQANNTSRNHYVTIGEETLTVAQWAERNNIPYKLVFRRTKDLGWTFEEALTRPVRKLERKKIS